MQRSPKNDRLPEQDPAFLDAFIQPGEPSSAVVLWEVERKLPELREQVIRILLDG